MRVVITGSSGFVGSHICRELLGTHKVIGIDDERMGVKLVPEEVYSRKLTVGALEDSPGIANALAGADVVIHASAHADISRNWTRGEGERKQLWQNNVNATMSLLEATPPNAHIIFLSTGAVYGDTVEPADGYSRLKPQTSPYSASKLAGEALVQAYAFARNAPWTVFRLGCCIGAGYHHGHIADFVRKAKDGVVEGLNDGRARRSFVHVKDVAKAVRLAIDAKISGTFNLATDTWCPRDTARVMGLDYVGPSKTHGWIGDPMAILSRQGTSWWKPELTVEQGVREALASLGWKCP